MQLIHKSLPMEHTVSSNQAGMRLDAALVFVFPDTGVRARRRLWEWCVVLVNNKPRLPGFIVTVNDIIRVIAKDNGMPVQKNATTLVGIQLLFLDDHFAVLSKPVGVHTAHIQGGKEASLELALPELWETMIRSEKAAPLWKGQIPQLLTRLDMLTSGIIIGARTSAAARTFREWEKEGCVRKTYFTVVQGMMQSPFCIRRSLHVENRKRTEIALNDTPDAIRWTFVTPLCLLQEKALGNDTLPYFSEGIQMPLIDAHIHEIQASAASGKATLPDATFSLCTNPPQPSERSFGEGGCTLAAVTIFCGARHQIRAHLAWAGFPLVGDTLYGATDARPLFLHHAVQQTPGFTVVSSPLWNEPV